MQGNTHKSLILQDYLTFYNGGCADNLTISQLKKILSIHGFTQLGNSSKEDIIEAVRSLHMTPPVRTTTSTNSVPLISLHAAALSVREVTRDMQVIGWEECPVQSVKTIEPKVPAMSPSLSFVRPVPQTNVNLKEKDNDALSICELPNLKFSKKARTVVKKRADKCSWRFSGCMNISGVPYKRSRNDERSDLQSSVGEEGANKYVKELKLKAKKRKKTVLVSSIISKNDESCPGSNTGHVSIKRSPHCQRRYDERSNLQSSVGEEGANKDVKVLSKKKISGEVATIQVLAKNSKNADPYTWHRSGNMRIMGLPYHRHYYKCSEIGCFAKKHIDRDANDPSICTVTYKGQHNHGIP